jgi:Protein of unknown function (DUF3592)
MQLTKLQFGVILMVLVMAPFIGYKAIWLLQSVPANGTMCFMGKSQNGQFSSTYPVIKFNTPKGDTIFFNGLEQAEYQPGQRVPIRYHKSNPHDARINQFAGIWQDTLVYALVPFVLLLMVLLHPEIIPRGARTRMGGKPFFRVLVPGK